SELPLPQAFEWRVAGADDLADRMRRESGRVHQRASLEAGLASEQTQFENLGRRLGAGVQEKTELDSAWAALWATCGIDPRSPREMRAWLDSFHKLRDRIAQLRLLRQRADETAKERSNHIQALIRELQDLERTAPGPVSLGAVLDISEETVAAGEELLRQREGLDREIHRLKQEAGVALADRKSAESGLEKWQAQWREAIAELGLGADASPAEADEIVENLRMLLEKLGDAEERSIRIGGIDEDGGAFREQVTSMVAQVAPELSELTAEEAVPRLNALLKTNRLNESGRRQAAEQMETAQREIDEADSTIRVVDERLQGFCLEARCNGPEDLGAAERRSDAHRDLNSQLNAVEREILETGEGGTLEELEKEAGGVDPDTLSGKIQELAGKIEQELAPGQAELAETKGRQQKELELMDGGDRAAELAQQAQAVLAGIRSKAEEYTRVKLAAYILRREIERYRKDNQGPLVDRASEHFASLTLGSFEGLRTDFNEKDEPVLVGVRAGGDLVGVEGMSSGTRDQLYLALRLASLEKYIEHAEPMPFIVDDILVHFDDRRSKATLLRLAQLAEKTQVIVFTHHARLVEQAGSLEAGAPVEVHELNGG
ncbi:MAG: chromosome segregation protein SMC, partial [Pseudomonadota bacterium]|nr:chromosome segregation protein SMC [Pseudomonadota bacterium]